MSNEQPLTLNQLPPDAKEIIKTKRILARKNLTKWLIFLKTLSQFDAGTDSVLKKAQSKVTGSIVMLGITFFLFVFGLVFTEGNIIVLAVGLSMALFVAFRAIFYGVKASKLKKVNLSNDFRETMLPLLDYLSEDILPKGKILLDLDMSEASDKKHQVSKAKIPPGKFKKLTETVYESRSCSASIPLMDGTLLKLDITKKLASYARYYRASSGKYKTKTKWKLLTIVTTTITPNEEDLCVNESDVESLAVSEKIKVAEKKGDLVCKLTRKFKFKDPLGGIPQDCVSPEAIIEMYMTLCSTLKPKVA